MTLHLNKLPTREVVDWVALADLAIEHGEVVLPEDAITPHQAKAGHVSLHRKRLGLFHLKDGGWHVAPLRWRHEARQQELPL